MTASGQAEEELWKTINMAIDMFFLIDVVINFNTAYLDHEEVLHATRGEIAKNYLKSWFLIDFFSAFPFDLVSGRSDG